MNPSSELIGEMKVTQFNNNAEFSQLADVTIITKSGTNTLHGSAFEYMQNSAFDAATYGFDSKAHKAYNTFGGSFSGPVADSRPLSGQGPDVLLRRLRRQPASLHDAGSAVRAHRRHAGGRPYGVCPAAPQRIPSTGAPFPGNRIPGDANEFRCAIASR